MEDERHELLEIVRDLRETLEAEAASAAAPEAPPVEVGRPEAPAGDPDGDAAAPDLRTLRQQLGECQRCALHEARTSIVFGEGSPTAEIVFVGEAPGGEEDRQGRPFVGPAGTMLTAMITNVLRMERSDVYICNVLKCRPPRNRNPQPEEVACCTPVVEGQLAAIRPALIVALGRFATQYLLAEDGPVGRYRGRVRQRPDGTPVVVTYHPAYLLRNEGDKRKAMDDLMLVRTTYEQLTGKQLPPVRRKKR